MRTLIPEKGRTGILPVSGKDNEESRCNGTVFRTFEGKNHNRRLPTDV